ncbi:MAG TPA: peptidoglycan-associated lipoprotein Pal [Terriglobia bacterium]|nr:peptidoglycan-associated lipoprotein Pal [Terriglobia bacterium]
MITLKRLRFTFVAIMAILIVASLSSGCKKKAPAPPPPPPPPAAPAPKPTPTVTLSASPTSIERGQSSTLTWDSTNATNVSIDQGIGDVSTSGSRSVSPSASTTYTITARGEGGTTTATARITVTAPAPPPPAQPIGPSVEELFQEKVRDIFFDYDKSDIRDDAKPILAANSEFLKQNPSIRFAVEGHCDERGSEEYNIGLGDRRATATKEYLTTLGISVDRINTISYGKEKPQCTEKTEECYQKNRRSHFVLAGR